MSGWDDSYDPSQYDSPGMPEVGWGCVLYRNGEDRAEGAIPMESLWSITFGGDGSPWGDPYKRVVEAKLALQAMPEQTPRARPVRKAYCTCCASYKPMWLYKVPTIYGIKNYCAPCCRSLGFRPGFTSDGIKM